MHEQCGCSAVRWRWEAWCPPVFLHHMPQRRLRSLTFPTLPQTAVVDVRGYPEAPSPAQRKLKQSTYRQASCLGWGTMGKGRTARLASEGLSLLICASLTRRAYLSLAACAVQPLCAMQRSAIILLALACGLACASACSQVFFGDSSLHAHGRRLAAVSAVGALAMRAGRCRGAWDGRAISSAAAAGHFRCRLLPSSTSASPPTCFPPAYCIQAEGASWNCEWHLSLCGGGGVLPAHVGGRPHPHCPALSPPRQTTRMARTGPAPAPAAASRAPSPSPLRVGQTMAAREGMVEFWVPPSLPRLRWCACL